MRWCGEEFYLTGKRSSRYDVENITRIITSDYMFKSLLAGRFWREQILYKPNMLIKHHIKMKNDNNKYDVEGDLKYPPHLDLETGENSHEYIKSQKHTKNNLQDSLLFIHDSIPTAF